MTTQLDERALRSAAEQYARDGFYLSPQIIAPDLISRVSAELDEQASAEPFRSLPPTKLRKMDTAQVTFPAIHELCSHPAIGRLVAAITGASMVQTFVTQQLIKPPGGTDTGNVGWHQDLQYWNDYVRGELLTAWVAVSDVTPDTGPMRFIRGSHTWGLLNAGDFFGADLDALKANLQQKHGSSGGWEEVPAVLKPGCLSLHHCLTIHGSGPNKSAGSRKSVAIHVRTDKSALAPGVKYGAVGWLHDFADNKACPVMYRREDALIGERTMTVESVTDSRHAPAPGLDTVVEDIDRQGFALLPGFVDRAVTASVRDTIERTIASGRPGDTGSTRLLYRIMHPCDEPILTTLAADKRLAGVARHVLRCNRPDGLRLRQQMFMKTLPADRPQPAPKGGHVDSPFLPSERDATPRQTYLQFFVYCSDVRPGGGSVYVSPGSHRLAYEMAAQLGLGDDRDAYAPAWVGRLNIPMPIEVTGSEGDLIVFDPMCVHSGSDNRTADPRYVYHCSYYDSSAAWVQRHRDTMCDPFPPSLRESLPTDMKHLLSLD